MPVTESLCMGTGAGSVSFDRAWLISAESVKKKKRRTFVREIRLHRSINLERSARCCLATGSFCLAANLYNVLIKSKFLFFLLSKFRQNCTRDHGENTEIILIKCTWNVWTLSPGFTLMRIRSDLKAGICMPSENTLFSMKDIHINAVQFWSS